MAEAISPERNDVTNDLCVRWDRDDAEVSWNLSPNRTNQTEYETPEWNFLSKGFRESSRKQRSRRCFWRSVFQPATISHDSQYFKRKYSFNPLQSEFVHKYLLLPIVEFK